MKMKEKMKQAAAAVLGLFLCAVCLSQPAAAIEKIPDLDKTCSLTIQFRDPNVNFRLYRVASVDASVRFTKLPTITNLPVGSFNGIKNAGEWRDLAQTLTPYLRAGFTPLRQGKTDASRRVTFTNLPTGLYLVAGDLYSVTDENGKTTHYQPMSYLVCLPYWMENTPQGGSGDNGGSWVYDLTVDASRKVEEIPFEKVDCHVIKTWERGATRVPVTVQLLKNGKVEETITLSDGNNWRYSWKGLDAGYQWEVVERQNGYRVTISKSVNGSEDGDTLYLAYSIHNAPISPDSPGTDPEDPSDDPPSPPNPPKRDPENPSNPSDPDIPIDDPDVPLDQLPPIDPDDPLAPPDEEVEIDDPDVPLEDLPQTGQLWWPVPILAVIGMFLFLLGWGLHRRGEFSEE